MAPVAPWRGPLPMVLFHFDYVCTLEIAVLVLWSGFRHTTIIPDQVDVGGDSRLPQ